MKRIVAFLLTILVLLGLSGCKKENGITLEELNQLGSLKIAVVADCAPYVLQGEDGSLSGIEIDLLRRVCDDLGATPAFTVLSREEALEGVEKGDYHLAAGMLSEKCATEQDLIYTHAYAKIPQVIVCKLDGSFHKMTDLQVKRLGARDGTYAHALAAKEGYFLFPYATYAELIQGLADDTVAALLMDRWVANTLVPPYDETVTKAGDIVVLDATVTNGTHNFALARGSEEIAAKINETVSTLAADGVMADIFSAYSTTYHSPYN